MTAKIHRSEVGTYHPEPDPNEAGRVHSDACEVAKGQPSDDCPICSYVAWTINDTRGYIDGGPACDECGACDCAVCPDKANANRENPEDPPECIGLSFAYVCLDGGDALCEECAEKAGIVIVECDCA